METAKVSMGRLRLGGVVLNSALQPTFTYRNPTASVTNEVSLATMTSVSAFLEDPLY